MPAADLAYDSGQHSKDIPSAMESERLIAKKAPAAIRVLEERNALDLAEALGLSNYLRNHYNGRS